jgi:hypothetical protein
MNSFSGPVVAGAGLRVDGLPRARARTTADRLWAALVNSGLLGEAPSGVARLQPPVGSLGAPELDLAMALAFLARAGVVGRGLRWILASGRLGLDGTVYGRETAPMTLAEVVRSCQTPLLSSEHMFEAPR